jgi:hypothetical protein
MKPWRWLLQALCLYAWVLMAAWHAGQWRDALLTLPITPVAMAVVLLPFAVMSWQASTQPRCHYTLPPP